MTSEQLAVLEFHRKFGLTVNDTPTSPKPQARALRVRLIEEELQELRDAKSLVDVADALGDLLYVVLGADVTYGIDLEPIFKEIHRSNMTKLWPGGRVMKDEHGKVLKPVTYSKANIGAEVIRQAKL